MKTSHMKWTALGMIAITALMTSACGLGGQVQGRTYVATGMAGAQSAYGYNGYNTGYGYNPYNTGYGNTGYNPYNTGYGNTGYHPYNTGYNGYNTGYGNGMQGGAGDSISFDDNFRATYRQASTQQTIVGSYSYIDSSNQTLSFRPDQQAAGAQQPMMNTMSMQETRFTVANDGSSITNLSTGQMMMRQ